MWHLVPKIMPPNSGRFVTDNLIPAAAAAIPGISCGLEQAVFNSVSKLL